MANHPSALKRARQSVKRSARNTYWISTIRTQVKRVREAVAKANKEEAKTLLKNVTSLFQKASRKGVIPSNTASRKVSRLTKAVNGIE